MDGKRILVTGHRGMVGSAIVRRLQREDCTILTATRQEVDLIDQSQVNAFMHKAKPDAVVHAAAKVGGIFANDTYPAEFLYENILSSANVIHAAHQASVGKFVYLGSSCVYPKYAPQPLTEDSLLSGPLEPTNEWYAVAKISGIKMCQAYRRQYGDDFISVMPPNLYGPNDNFDLKNSHVLPALIRKFHEAKAADAPQVEMWGTGTPKREFLHVDDLADGVVFALKRYSDEEFVNIGAGSDIEIRSLAKLISEIVGYSGAIVLDSSKPDGTPRKIMDSTTFHGMGWKPSMTLREGIESTYQWYLNTLQQAPEALRA
ncbi:MAG: GDP-L-fucose synthase [Ahrensia sp.]|nr:GDP-L-fucose synthase [Ahrensia sp.]